MADVLVLLVSHQVIFDSDFISEFFNEVLR
jgi:hypothetical protein